jgi:phospholipid/cholesterol/gamma-HCH transport system ATP-binding protein
MNDSATPSPNKQPLIQVKNLKKRYTEEGAWVLDNISFEVFENEVLAIIGTSGCGKSTLLKCIAGLECPTEGEVLLNDPNYTLVFQYSALFDSLNVFENVAFALLEPPDDASTFHRPPRKEIVRQVQEKLKMVGLEGIEEKFPNELSGGMQKRVSFARAIMSNPRIILYDEPTSGLDPVASNTLEDYMNVLSKELKAASVVVTHTLSTICRTAHRVILLNEGVIHWTGTPYELLHTDDPIASRFAKAALDTTSAVKAS